MTGVTGGAESFSGNRHNVDQFHDADMKKGQENPSDFGAMEAHT